MRERRSRLRAAVFAEVRTHPSYRRTVTGLDRWKWLTHLQRVARRLDAEMPAPLGTAEADDIGAQVARTTAPWSHDSESQSRRARVRWQNQRDEDADRNADILTAIESGKRQCDVAKRYDISPRTVRRIVRRLRTEKADTCRSEKADTCRRSYSSQVLPAPEADEFDEALPAAFVLPEGWTYDAIADLQDRYAELTRIKRQATETLAAAVDVLNVVQAERDEIQQLVTTIEAGQPARYPNPGPRAVSQPGVAESAGRCVATEQGSQAGTRQRSPVRVMRHGPGGRLASEAGAAG